MHWHLCRATSTAYRLGLADDVTTGMLSMLSAQLYVACCMSRAACLAWCLLYVACSMLRVACCLLSVAGCMLQVVGCMVHVACCLLHVVMLSVACCLLRVACIMLAGLDQPRCCVLRTVRAIAAEHRQGARGRAALHDSTQSTFMYPAVPRVPACTPTTSRPPSCCCPLWRCATDSRWFR